MSFKQKVLPLYKIMKAKHLNTTITPHRSLISFGINGVCKVIRRKTFLFELFDVYYLAFPNNWLTHRLTTSQLSYLDTRIRTRRGYGNIGRKGISRNFLSCFLRIRPPNGQSSHKQASAIDISQI